MRKNFLKLIGITAFVTAILPLITSAQNTEKEYYLRPSYWRPYDQRGINVFETSKVPDSIPFEGLRVRFGAGFTQQYQNIKESNDLAVNNSAANRLYPIQSGFMTAMANLNLDVQLADGIRLNMTTYLSTRHHNEAWVKGGYIQFDKLPFKAQFWQDLMKIATIKVGHMEINYGDAHFRRTDGGQALWNPFMDNYIVDAYTTEIGGEVYLQKNGLFGMLGVTNGMLKGSVDSTYITKDGSGNIIDDNTRREPSIYLKGGFDKSIGSIRARVSGSYYHNGSSAASGNTLYWGDRTGSNYQNVMEKAGGPIGVVLPASTSIPWSGRVNPNFSKKVDAVMLNGFLKLKGLELFGTYETATGRTSKEVSDRKMTQWAGDVVYRFGLNDNLFAGVRYNTVKVDLGFVDPVTVNRTAVSAGWFVSRNILMKAEIVDQRYNSFPTTDYRAGGKFSGYVIEAVVGF